MWKSDARVRVNCKVEQRSVLLLGLFFFFFFQMVFVVGHSGVRRERSDAPCDLHDSVTHRNICFSALRMNLSSSHLGRGGICGFHHVQGNKRHISCVAMCVCVCRWRWGGRASIASALHANLTPSSHLLFSNCCMSTI